MIGDLSKKQMAKNFPSRFAAILLLTLLLSASCISQNQKPKIRIVDLQGNVRPVVTRVPELNAQYVNSKTSSPTIVDQGSIKSEPSKNTGTVPTRHSNTIATFKPVHQPKAQDGLKESYADITEKTFNTSQTTPETIAETGLAPDQGNVTQYDLDDPSEKEVKIVEAVKKTAKQKIAKTKKSNNTSVKKQKGFYAQVGSFSSNDSAKKKLDDMQQFHGGMIETVRGKKTLYRVLLGPIKDRKAATSLVRKINDAGHEAILVR